MKNNLFIISIADARLEPFPGSDGDTFNNSESAALPHVCLPLSIVGVCRKTNLIVIYFLLSKCACEWDFYCCFHHRSTSPSALHRHQRAAETFNQTMRALSVMSCSSALSDVSVSYFQADLSLNSRS